MLIAALAFLTASRDAAVARHYTVELSDTAVILHLDGGESGVDWWSTGTAGRSFARW
jgi:hypothetical protein